jgi:hypothetical protein
MATEFERRLARLEQRFQYSRSDGVGCAIHLQGCESVADACRRLGLPDCRGRIVVGEVMAPEDWNNAAKAQQSASVRDRGR